MQRILPTILVAGLSLAFIGCGERHGLIPVSITITQKGNPLEGATVSAISSDGQGHSSSATTNASGVAVMFTPAKGAGVLPGEYNVAVKKWESYEVKSPSSDDPNGVTTEQQNILPAKYGEHSSSGFKLTVGSKATEVSFDIGE